MSNDFDGNKAKVVLNAILEALNSRSGFESLQQARDCAGNDMVGLMTKVFPLVTQISLDVISQHGFSNDGVGAIQFENLVKSLEQDDPEIATLHAQVRSYYLPAVVLPTDA